MAQKGIVMRGKTVEDAVNKALAQLSVARDQVEVKILQKPKSILGLRILAEVEVSIIDKPNSTAPTQPVKEQEVENTNATVSIEDGKLKFTPEKDGGRAATLIISEDITVYYGGQQVKGRVELTDGVEPLEIKLPEDTQPATEIDIVISSDKMSATLEGKRISGVSYSLYDQPASSITRLKLAKKTQPASPFSLDEIKDRVLESGIKYGLKLDTLTEEVLRQSVIKVEIAKGVPPTEPEDAKIEYVFDRVEPEVDLFADRVDHYEVRGVVSIDEGSLLAKKIPTKDGTPGISVFGDKIEPPTSRDVELKVGEGVTLSNDQLQAFAERAGLPILQNGILKVVNVYELDGDADVSTGHIRFKGEIIIKGNVCEKVKVQSFTGGVHVFGFVSSAEIVTDGDIVVNKNVVGSRLAAGGNTVVSIKLHSFVHSITSDIEQLLQGFRLIREQSSSEDGKLLKSLLELKFHSIPRVIRELTDYCRGVTNELSPEENSLINNLARVFLGRGPLEIADISQIEDLLEKLKSLEERLEEQSSETADIYVPYLQNCRLECSGHVYVKGQGSYYSEVMAGTGYTMPQGVFRGGSIIVDHGDIQVKEVGGPTGIATEAAVVHEGQITAKKVYPNVTVKVANHKFKFDTEAKNVKAFFSDESLKVYSGALELT